MAGATVRGRKAGSQMGRAIVEMVHLMYQNNTAAHFYRGLIEVVRKEMKRRGLEVTDDQHSQDSSQGSA